MLIKEEVLEDGKYGPEDNSPLELSIYIFVPFGITASAEFDNLCGTGL